MKFFVKKLGISLTTVFVDPNYPFQPSRFPIFYGWVILVSSIMNVIMSIPGQTIGVSVFTDHLLEATGLSRLDLSNAYLLGTLISGCLLPFGGALLDRLGARLIIFSSALGLSLTLFYLSAIDRLAAGLLQHFSTLSSDINPLMRAKSFIFMMLIVGFTSLRFNGQGMLTMASRTTLGKWFDRWRGKVSGIEGVVIACGFALAPWVISHWINAMGWRQTWRSMATVIGFGGLMGWFLIRDNPEQCGLLMDGATPETAISCSDTTANLMTQTSSETSPKTTSQAIFVPNSDEPTSKNVPSSNFKLEGYTRREALNTLAFWAAVLALASHALAMTGITFHIIDIGVELGLSAAQMVRIFIPIAIVATVIGVLTGIASDRIRLQTLYILMMVFQGIGFSALGHYNLFVFQWIVTISLGITAGCFGTLLTVTLPRFFGRACLGAIAGVQTMTIVLASALGPTLLAWFKETLHSYKPGLYICAGFSPIIIILMAFAQTPPQQRVSNR